MPLRSCFTVKESGLLLFRAEVAKRPPVSRTMSNVLDRLTENEEMITQPAANGKRDLVKFGNLLVLLVPRKTNRLQHLSI